MEDYSEDENLSEEDEIISEEEDHVSIEDSSSSDEEIDTEGKLPAIMMSKDGKVIWKNKPYPNTGRFQSRNILNLTPGPTRFSAARVEDEYTAFELLFPHNLKIMIVNYTNIEGKRVYLENWRDLNIADLDAYIGLLLLAGVYRSSNEATTSLWDEYKGRHLFRATMSLKKFKMISRVIRFDDRETRQRRRSNDKFAAIRELWDKWVEILPNLFNPEAYVTVDEQLIAFRGKCPFRQYMPSKPAKYGIKFWILCDTDTCYVWNIQPYLGKQPGSAPEKNQGLRVVLDLSYGLRGHNITCDNFFTSYDLGQMLLRRNITMIGTIRKNKTSIPSEILQTKGRERYSSTFAFTDDATLVSYIPKKNKCVVLQSTLHKDEKIDQSLQRKPEIINDYNKTKGAVDTLDKMVATYTTKRKTNRWPVVVFSNILDISAYNAFVLYCKINKSWKKDCSYQRRIFLENLGEKLIKKHMETREHLPRGKAAKEIVQSTKKISKEIASSSVDLEVDKKRGRCHLCEKTDNKSTFKCATCNYFTCKKHFKTVCNNCYKE